MKVAELSQVRQELRARRRTMAAGSESPVYVRVGSFFASLQPQAYYRQKALSRVQGVLSS
jgi:hypothetical protein